jgi:SRSO17 transposase
MQEFMGTSCWDHRPLIEVLVGQVADRLSQSDGIIPFDPNSFPKRGTHSVGVKRQWCSHRGKVDNCQVGVFMGYVSGQEHALLDFRLSLPEEWARNEPRRQKCHVPSEVRYRTRHEQCLEMLDEWRNQVPHSWVSGFATPCAGAVSAMCWGYPAIRRFATWKRPCRRIVGVDDGPRHRGNR